MESVKKLESSEFKFWNPLTWSRPLYNWMMKWADYRHSGLALGTFSFIESIFFPLPVDPIIVAMGTAKPKKAISFALIATVGSVAGALGGYLLGALFWEATSGFFYQYVFPPEKFELVIQKFNENAFLAIFLASFTPIPYKVFTIAGGVAGLSLPIFIIASLIGRGMRFGIIGISLFFFGQKVRGFLEKHLERLTIIFGFLVVVAFVIYKYLKT